MPAAPTGWHVTVKRPVASVRPGRMPARARYTGQVEWAWSPMHMPVDAYYLSMCTKHRNWLLWVKGYDDNWERWTDPGAAAYSPHSGLNATDAARLLLAAYWRHERIGGELDRFH